MTTNSYERNFYDQGSLKRPGRIDLRLFQNIDNAGDGKPGLQKAFRNYIHEGGFEKDLQLIGHGIKGTSVDITNAELQQLSNIISVTITNDQWAYLGASDQGIAKSTNPFEVVRLTLSQTTGTAPMNITSTTLVTNLNSDLWDGYQFADYLDQAVKTGSIPTFGGLTLNGNLSLGTNTLTTTNTNLVSNLNADKVDGYDFNQSVQTTSSPRFTNINIDTDIIHYGDTDTKITFGTNIQNFQTGGTTRLDISNSGVRFGGTGSIVTDIESSVSTSTTKIVTSGGVKTYADTKLALSGGTMSGNIIMGTNKLTGLGDGSTNGDSVRYEQVCRLSDVQTIAGVKTFSSFPITPSESPTTDYQVANKAYADIPKAPASHTHTNTRYGAVDPHIFVDGGTIGSDGVAKLTAVGDKVFVHWRFPSTYNDMKDSVAFLIYIVFSSTVADTSITIKRALAKTYSGQSISWNIWNDVSDSLNAATANYIYTKQLAVDAADVDYGYLYRMKIELNEGSRNISIYNIKIIYSKVSIS